MRAKSFRTFVDLQEAQDAYPRAKFIEIERDAIGSPFFGVRPVMLIEPHGSGVAVARYAFDLPSFGT